MHQLHITQFLGWDMDKIAEHIKAKAGKDIELLMPIADEDASVADDYLLAAYLGEKLAEACEAISYDKVKPGTKKKISFRLSKASTADLAAALYYMCPAFETDYSEEYYQLTEALALFARHVEDGEIKPVCPYFMEVYAEHKENMEEEEEEE